MQEAAQKDSADSKKIETTLYERLLWQSRLGPGLFKVCLTGIRREIADVGGPSDYLQLLQTFSDSEK